MKRLLPSVQLVIQALLGTISLLPALALSAPTDFDTDFSSDGKMGVGFSSLSQAEDLAILSNGRMIVAGFTQSSLTGSKPDFAIAKLLENGDLDVSFSSDGKLTHDFSSSGDRCYSLAVQSDDKIVLAGSSAVPVSGASVDIAGFAMLRLDANGALDTAFGEGGEVFLQLSESSHDSIEDIAIQDDGKIVAVGRSVSTNFGSNGSIVVARFNSSGSLDSTFGTAGIFTAPLSPNYYTKALALQTDGKILVTGYYETGNQFDTRAFLIRVLANGQLDGSFGNSGLVTASVGDNQDTVWQIALQSDGNIVLGGSATLPSATPSLGFALFRFLPDGSPDLSFSNDGKCHYPCPSGASVFGTALALQDDGKVVAVGHTIFANDVDNAFLRVNTDGEVDDLFASGGQFKTDVFDDDYMRVVRIQPDGKIIGAGYSQTSSSGGFINVIRLEGGTLPIPIPDIAIEQPAGVELVSGVSFVDFSNVAIGAVVTKEFVIKNVDFGLLDTLSVTVSGAHSADFSVDDSLLPAGGIVSGGSGNVIVSFQPAASGIRFASLAVSSNDPDENPFTVSLVGQGTTATALLNEAITASGLSGSDAGFLETPFGDGIPNLIKYAFNMNLSGADATTMSSGGTSGLPTYGLDDLGPETVWRVEFLRRKGSGLSYTPLKSTTLDSFTPMTGAVTVSDIDEQWERVVVEEPCDPATTPKCFSRVQVELP